MITKPRELPQPMRYVLQAFNYAIFIALVWYFSSAPAIRILADDEAVLTIAFAHAGQLRGPCRRLSQEELNQLAPNMRKLEECPRERSPVRIEAELDGEPIYRDSLAPPGLFGDGGVDIFYSRKIPAGTYELALRMNDSVRIDDFNHALRQRVTIEPGRILLVGFDARKGFILSQGAR